MNTLQKFTTESSGRRWEGERDVLYLHSPSQRCFGWAPTHPQQTML